MVKITRISLGILCFLLAIQTTFGQNTANNAVSAYNSPFQYGVNGAYAGNNWNDNTLAKIASNAGSNSIRVGLYDYFLEQYGNNVRTSTFNYYTNTLHFSDNIVFLNGAANDHVDMTTYPGCSQHSLVFKNVYLPIWNVDANGNKTVNPDNYYAQYVANVVANYGSNIKFYEIWNEPDFTYGSNGYAAKGAAGNWFDNAPAASDLTNLQAPVFYYIRMLHIAYEVIKSMSPNSMVATGGLGYSSFLDVLLRYTDNPDNGKVTSAYPLTGGAYFDVLSFHSYPFYELAQWSNAQGKMVYTRHSDGNADRFLVDKQAFNTVLSNYQYDGSKYPAKYFICTESNVPSRSDPNNPGQYGTPEMQRNFVIKALVSAQVNGVKQMYLYALDNGPGNTPVNENDFMGIYNYLAPVSPGQETLTDEGTAYKTVSNQLRGLGYDASATATLKLPATAGGAVFSGLQNGVQTQKIVVWARTTVDESESGSATITLPASSGSAFKQFAWNAGSDTTAYVRISGNTINLTTAPVFLVSSAAAPALASLKANSGQAATITLPASTITLDGSASTATNTTITSWTWKEVTGAVSSIQSAGSAKTTVSGLKQGTYSYQLNIADNSGHKDSAQVTITVNAAATTGTVLANAGQNQSLLAPTNATNLDGSASSATNTTISTWLWKQLSGPSNVIFQTPGASKTILTGMITGKYVFMLRASDPNNIRDSASVTVVVNPSTSSAGVTAYAGTNQTITAPATTASLDGTGSTGQNTTITSWTWTQLHGPGYATFSTTTSARTSLSQLEPGNYVFQLKVSDNSAHIDSSQVSITVNAASGSSTASLKANAGTNQTIISPTDTTTLVGTASNVTNTTITSYRWKQLQGPSGIIWASTTSINTKIAGLQTAMYVFELIIADNSGHRDSSLVTINVINGAADNSSSLVTAHAGVDQTINLPVNTVSLDGSGSVGNAALSYNWKQVSGPASAAISSNQAVSTSATSLVAGMYTFELNVRTVSGSKDSAQVKVNVLPATSSSFSLYPNPAVSTTTLALNYKQTGPTLVQVYTTSGVLVMSYNLNKPSAYLTQTYNVSSLATGVYIIRIQTGATVKSMNFIKN